MKTAAVFLTLLLGATCQNLLAYDPAGPPPGSSLSRTVRHVSTVKVARVDFPDGLLSEVLYFIRVPEIPKASGVVIDAGRMKLPDSTRVKIVAKDITILEAAAMVAEQLNADLLIEPGRILLVPKAGKNRR